ncbi:hypothetical protein Mgra_00002086, partial [Meloidogyne graminicola]
NEIYNYFLFQLSAYYYYYYYFLLIFQIFLINAKICNEENEEKINLILSKTLKICPDFKDEPEQIACCPSQITSGTFFCCTEQHKNNLESELASEARKKFISEHIPQLILIIFVVEQDFVLYYIEEKQVQEGRGGGGGNSSIIDSSEFSFRLLPNNNNNNKDDYFNVHTIITKIFPNKLLITTVH